MNLDIDRCGTGSAATAKEPFERCLFPQVTIDLISKLLRELEQVSGGSHGAVESVWVFGVEQLRVVVEGGTRCISQKESMYLRRTNS